MIAMYKGANGSMGFRTGLNYFIELEWDNFRKWIWVREKTYGLYCSYSSVAAVAANWELLPQTIEKEIERYKEWQEKEIPQLECRSVRFQNLRKSLNAGYMR